MTHLLINFRIMMILPQLLVHIHTTITPHSLIIQFTLIIILGVFIYQWKSNTNLQINYHLVINFTPNYEKHSHIYNDIHPSSQPECNIHMCNHYVGTYPSEENNNPSTERLPPNNGNITITSGTYPHTHYYISL